MFMVAILESLKVSDVRHPPVEEPSSSVGSDILKSEPAPKNEEDHFFSCSNSLKTESVSTSAANEHKPPSDTPLPDPNQLLPVSPSEYTPSSETETHETCSPSNISKDDATVLKNSTSNVAAPHPEGEISRPTSHSDTTSDNQRSSDVDMADRTTVTVEVEKNPSTNIIDGLLRRWDFNFFRNR